ncbi:MAG: NAD-dependent epimerase [Betaproteobacteria bacterium]|nr:NAD-dependent epimerase [Betaproteobacteria bacterium]
MKVLVTGAAGFIGCALALRLLARGDGVTGVDNLNDYYDAGLKYARLARLQKRPGFRFLKIDIADREPMADLFARERFRAVVHLAAQAGVRYALENSSAYIDSNLTGFSHVLEGCRSTQVAHLVFASSSSVYGANTRQPFSEHQNVDHPLSLYAATKKANELMAHSYAHLYRLPCTGLRFFTVYGPWGRPDMSYFKFAQGILAGRPIPVFNRGDMRRDFTYIDDIVEALARVIDRPAAPHPGWNSGAPDPATSSAPYRLYNIGNNRPVKLLRYIQILEQCLGKKAILELMPMQPGDVPATCADISDLEAAVGFRPRTPVEVGIARFVEWYRAYYNVRKSTEARPSSLSNPVSIQDILNET